jgi:alpha-beta hydrolase superfamily lysophospholipase
VAFANLSPGSPAKVATDNAARGPLLITAGGKDHTVPAAVSESTLKRYRKSPAVTNLEEFPDRGHTLALDSRWREVADTVLNWLKKHSP